MLLIVYSMRRSLNSSRFPHTQATFPWINDTEITRRVSFRMQVRHICAQQLFSASGPEVVLIGIREVHVQDYLAWMTSKALKV